jgi:hypothetical protein
LEKYTFQEVVSRIKPGEKYQNDYLIITLSLDPINELFIKYKDGFNLNDIGISTDLSTKSFAKIQQPISFMDVVAKAKTNRFRFEHDLLNSNSNLGHTLANNLNILVKNFNNEQIADIILNGRCYLEEREE